jgi:hypothetical protein
VRAAATLVSDRDDLLTGCPRKVNGLDISEFEDGYSVYHPGDGRVHHLNPSAIVVLELCTGKNAPEAIARLLQKAYRLEQPPFEQVDTALQALAKENLVELAPAGTSDAES